jgi:hypothetical protein
MPRARLTSFVGFPRLLQTTLAIRSGKSSATCQARVCLQLICAVQPGAQSCLVHALLRHNTRVGREWQVRRSARRPAR